MHLERAITELGNLFQAGQHRSALFFGRKRAHVDTLVFCG